MGILFDLVGFLVDDASAVFEAVGGAQGDAADGYVGGIEGGGVV